MKRGTGRRRILLGTALSVALHAACSDAAAPSSTTVDEPAAASGGANEERDTRVLRDAERCWWRLAYVPDVSSGPALVGVRVDDSGVVRSGGTELYAPGEAADPRLDLRLAALLRAAERESDDPDQHVALRITCAAGTTVADLWPLLVSCATRDFHPEVLELEVEADAEGPDVPPPIRLRQLFEPEVEGPHEVLCLEPSLEGSAVRPRYEMEAFRELDRERTARRIALLVEAKGPLVTRTPWSGDEPAWAFVSLAEQLWAFGLHELEPRAPLRDRALEEHLRAGIRLGEWEWPASWGPY